MTLVGYRCGLHTAVVTAAVAVFMGTTVPLVWLTLYSLKH